MNITSGSVNHWLNIASYNNDTTTINGTTQGNSNPQLWDLRWFALLSGPLLFGTIILPLITGPTIRYLCQLHVKLRVYRSVAIFLLPMASAISSWVILSSDRSGLRALILVKIVLDSPCLIFLIYHVFSAWRKARHPKIFFILAPGFLVVSLIGDIISFSS